MLWMNAAPSIDAQLCFVHGGGQLQLGVVLVSFKNKGQI